MLKKYKDYIPVVIALIFAIVGLITYFIINDNYYLKHILQIFSLIIISLVIIIFNKLFKVKITMSVNLVLVIFAIFTVLFGGALQFYDRFPGYDKVAHTIFGIVGSFFVYIFVEYNCKDINKFSKFVIIFLGVLGMAAFWEMYEYAYSMIFNDNLQGWFPDYEADGNLTVNEYFKTYNPLYDTMWDINVAAIGVGIFYILLAIDYFCGSKVLNFFKKEVADNNSL